ncbi:hypothetical protein TNCV_1853011 [Trichonephila clavipes]|nr:hypothetical protein TNCV_1853011 [Trichonephila clavipes]
MAVTKPEDSRSSRNSVARQMYDSSVKTTSFHSANHLLSNALARPGTSSSFCRRSDQTWTSRADGPICCKTASVNFCTNANDAADSKYCATKFMTLTERSSLPYAALHSLHVGGTGVDAIDHVGDITSASNVYPHWLFGFVRRLLIS